MERKIYLDNIRWMTVLLVILYHIIYIFNNAGVISNFAVKGIPQMDVLLYFVYPWFMSLLFVVAGVSAHAALQTKTGKEFLKTRVKRLLIPSIAGIFLIGWFNGWVTDTYVDMFKENRDVIPGFVKYLIYCMSGIGTLWFAHQLFGASVVLVIIKAIDKKEKLGQLSAKCKLWTLFALVLPYWISSMLFNTPLIEVYRNGFYIFSFLLGYYVFSREELLEQLAKIRIPLFICSLVCGIAYTAFYYGDNYTTKTVLQHPFTNVYAWLMILTIFAWAKRAFNFKNKFSSYMTKANFGFYVLHYPVLCFVAYMTQRFLAAPMVVHYLVNTVILAALLPLVYEVLRRIPVLRFLILGISSQKNTKIN